MRRARVAVGLVVALAATVVAGPAADPAPAQTAAADHVEVAVTDTLPLRGRPPAEVAAALARASSPTPPTTVLLAREDTYPDALAAGALQGGAPLLLTAPDALSAPTRELLDEWRPDEVIVLGGTTAVGDAVVAALPGDPQVTRHAGPDRTATAATIATATRDRADVVLLARAFGTDDAPTRGFVDAIAAGAWAAQTGWPVLLTATETLSAATAAALDELDPDRVVVVGGTAAVSDTAAQQAAAGGRRLDRVAGDSRFATAAAVAAARGLDRPTAAVLLDGGAEDAWAAGFSAARYAAARQAPVLLADGEGLPGPTADALAAAGGAVEELVCTAAAAACLAARPPLGLPAGVTVALDPPPGQPLPPQTTVTATLDGGDRVGPATLEGTCLVDRATGADRLTATTTAAAQEGCTATVTIPLAGGVVQTVTATWPGGVPGVPGAHDYATDVHADPWDFANPEDVHLDHGPTIQVDHGRIADGELAYDNRGGTIHLLWQGYPGGALPVGRDGLVAPLDGDTYRLLAVRVHVPSPTAYGISWARCPTGSTADGCPTGGSVSGHLAAGWQTLVVDPGWNGEVHAVRFALAGTLPVRIDWARAYQPTGQGITVPGAVAWDTNPDRGDNTPDRPGWGPLDGPLPADAYPPGDYWFHLADGTTTGPIRIVPPPQIRILNPDAAGGEDYITAATGDPWDFDQPTDATVHNATDVRFEGGVLHARNANHDPHVDLRMAGPLDPHRYHRVTVTFANAGPMDLSFGPGGGTHGRLLWTRTDGSRSDGAEIVAYPNTRTYTFDALDPRAVEAGNAGWAAGPIAAVRFDPNEDPAAGREWSVDEVAIRADDESPGTVELAWTDTTPAELAEPTTVTWYADRDRQGFDGVAITGPLTQQPGRNAVTWTTCDTAPGTWWLYVVATRGATSTATYATGPLQVTNSAC